MAFEYLLSSLSAYSAVVAVPIAIGAIALTERGWYLLSSTTRSARTTLRPSQGSCERRLWADLKSGPVHMCTSIWPAQCHQAPHIKGARCWDRSFAAVVNNWDLAAIEHPIGKPQALPVSKDYVHVNLKVIFAFIFMTVNGPSEQIDARTFHIGGATLNLQVISPEVILLHLEGTLERILTKDYVERLLGGYPPLIEDPKNVSVFNAGDEARGGWVIALGLESNHSQDRTFFSAYSDCVHYRDRRGRVFWRSMDRVRRIITDIWVNAFAGGSVAGQDIATAIKALEYIHEFETQSGVETFFHISMPSRSLSAQEKHKIISHFNGPPLIAAGQRQQFQTDWEPLLHYVLVAAVRGSIRCIDYFKNQGRELENILPLDVLKKAELYLRGC